MKQRINPFEPPEFLDRYMYSIFDICEQLHMSKNGSGDNLTDEVWAMYVVALTTRLGTWIDGRSQEKTYDDAVKALIVATLKEQAE